MADLAPLIHVEPPRMPRGVLTDSQPPMVGYIPKKAEWIHHRFDLFAFGLVTAGEGRYSVGPGPVTRIRSGSLFAVYPGPTFHYGPDPGTTWEEYHVGLFAGDIRPWIRAGVFPRDGSVRRLTNLEPIVAAFQDLMATIQRGGPGDSDRAFVAAQGLFIELYWAQIELAPSRVKSHRIEAILAHCRHHFAEAVDFRRLARTHGIGYSRLRHELRLATGVAPHQYLIRLRCQHACALLADPELPIKEIAARVGIPDPYAFSRTFKHYAGLSPRNYRKRGAAFAPAG